MNTKDTDYSFRLEYVNKQGQREKIYNGISYDPYTQIMSGNWKFETLDENGNVIGERIHPLKMRQTYRQEMKYILEMCGIKIGTDNRVTISPNPGGHFEYSSFNC